MEKAPVFLYSCCQCCYSQKCLTLGESVPLSNIPPALLLLLIPLAPVCHGCADKGMAQMTPVTDQCTGTVPGHSCAVWVAVRTAYTAVPPAGVWGLAVGVPGHAWSQLMWLQWWHRQWWLTMLSHTPCQ